MDELRVYYQIFCDSHQQNHSTPNLFMFQVWGSLSILRTHNRIYANAKRYLENKKKEPPKR